MKNIITKTSLLIIVLTGFLFPQQNHWYKGNLHTHSLWSDGDNFPEMVTRWYKDHGYDFIAISDHNTLAEGEKWIEIDNPEINPYHDYINEFSKDWINTKIVNDTLYVKLKTLEEYRKIFEDPGKFLIIQSEEITDHFEKTPIHVNATNIQKKMEPQHGNSVLEVMQNNVDAVNKQHSETGEPMFPHINHPNYGWAVSSDDLINLNGDNFFEVYNGHPLVNNYGDSLHISTEKMWDIVLTERLKNKKNIMYGLAVDDAHNYFNFNLQNSNPGRGWVVVRSKNLTTDDIINSMLNGNFYSSTGVEIEDIKISKNNYSIKVNPEEGVEYQIKFIGTFKSTNSINEIGIVLKRTTAIEADYEFKGTELYVRAEVISSKKKGNPYKEGDYEKAWLQPVKIIKK